MPVVANLLSSSITNLGRPVVDRTGLTGEYTMQLEFTFRSPNQSADGLSSEETSAALFTAIQEQWGLKLQSVKGSINSLVIEQASRPSDN